MHDGHLPGDGQAEAAAGHLRAGQTLEALEHPFPCLGRDAWAGVADREQRRFRVGAQFDIHARPRRTVAQGVVDEVAQQHTQARALAHQAEGRALADAQVDAAGVGQRGEIGDAFLDQRVQGQRLELHAPRVRFEAGHVQQLFHQMRGAIHARRQLLQRVLTRGGILRPAGELGLQADGGERAAQFVGGVGDEAALAGHGAVQTREQVVEGIHQGRDLARQTRAVQRLQPRRATLHDLPAHLFEGRQRARHGGADEQAKHHHQHAERDQQPGNDQCELARAVGHVRRHLDGEAALLEGIYAPFGMVPLDDMQARLLQRRTDVVDGGIEQAAVGRPDLADELAAVVADFLVVLVFDAVAHHRIGDLFQPEIANAVETVPGQQVGDDAGEDAGQQQRADLPEQQAAADGVHCRVGAAASAGAAGSATL